MLKVFIWYALEDRDFLKALEAHLTGIRRRGLAEFWHDQKLVVGQERGQVVQHQLEAADIVLPLISSDFLDSDHCWDAAMVRALARHKVGTARVIPVILRACDWRQSSQPGRSRPTLQ